MPCSGILGFVRLGRLKAPMPHSTTFFCARKTLRVFLIGHKKRQLPRTLSARFNAEFIVASAVRGA